MRTPILLLAVAVLNGAASADEVFLKGGGQPSGRIVSRSATTIEVDVGAGRIGVPVSSVVRVEEGRSALHEYEERASRLAASDADGWVALGEWASARETAARAGGYRPSTAVSSPSSCPPRKRPSPRTRPTSRARSSTGRPRATGWSSSGRRICPAAPRTG